MQTFWYLSNFISNLCQIYQFHRLIEQRNVCQILTFLHLQWCQIFQQCRTEPRQQCRNVPSEVCDNFPREVPRWWFFVVLVVNLSKCLLTSWFLGWKISVPCLWEIPKENLSLAANFCTKSRTGAPNFLFPYFVCL